MNAVEVAARNDRLPMLTSSADEEWIAELAVELFRRGLLEPHLGKLSQMLETRQHSLERLNQSLATRYEPNHITLFRALLDPNFIATSSGRICGRVTTHGCPSTNR